VRVNKIHRPIAVVCLVIMIAGLAAGALPVALLDSLEPVDSIFGAIPFLAPPGYDGAMLPQPPSSAVRSLRAPPLA
jgi:hypothetical protein